MPILYRIGAVSKLTGISVDTLRAWERRYGAVSPSRGENQKPEQQRGYGDAEIERLLLLRNAVESGHAISTVAKLSDDELRQFMVAAKRSRSHVPDMLQPLLAAIDDFDHSSLNEQLGRMASLLHPVDMVHQVVLPVMREVGERWHRGEMTVAQEHLTTANMLHVLGSLMRLHRPAPKGARMIYSSPDGELHCIGILAAAMLAAVAGLSPIYLGPGLPAKEIVAASRKSRAKVVILQVVLTGQHPQKQIRQILEGLPESVELWVGGNMEFKDRRIRHLTDFSMLDENYRRIQALC
jgi:methanogenic corrinoid protein MtbC1